MPGMSSDNLTGKDVILDIGLSESDSKLLNQLTDLMGELLPMVRDTTEALGKVMNTSHETFAAVRDNMDKHGETAKKVTGVQLEMRDALSETAKGVEALTASTAKLTEAMEKYSGTAQKAKDATKDDGGGGIAGAVADAVEGGAVKAEEKAGSLSATAGSIRNLFSDMVGKAGKDVLSGTIETVLGRGTVGSAVGGAAESALGGAGAAAAPILAALAGYKAWESASQLQSQYAGAIGNATMTEATGYEAKARMMALSPFLTSEQSHQIVMSTLKSGYQGVEANTVMDFVAKNVKSGVLSVDQSIGLYKNAVEKAGASTEGITLQLDHLRETAANTSASVEELAAGFTRGVGDLTASGLSGNVSTTISGVLTDAYAGSKLEGVVTPTAMLSSAMGQNAIGMILSGGTGRINSANFTAEMAKLGPSAGMRVANAFQGWALNLLAEMNIAPGTDVNTIDDYLVRQVGARLVAYGVMTSQNATVENVRLWIDYVLSGKADPQGVMDRRMEEDGPKSLDDTMISLPWEIDQTARRQLTQEYNGGDLLESAAAGLQLDANKYLPLLDKWIRQDWGKDALVEINGKPVYLMEHLQSLKTQDAREAFVQDVINGKYRIAQGDRGIMGGFDYDFINDPEKRADLEWTEGGVAGIYNAPSETTSFTANGVTIGFDPTTAKYLRFILPDSYEGLLGLPNYGGPSDGPPPGSGNNGIYP